MKIRLVINNEEETDKLAKIIAGKCFSGFLLTLNGELGAGKTRLAKGIGEGLGIKQTINSPTFNILKCYFGGRLPFYHIDAYRLEGLKQDLGFEEYIEGDGVCLVEWSFYIDYLLPKEYLDIAIYIIDENKREFVIDGIGDRYENIVKEINDLWK